MDTKEIVRIVHNDNEISGISFTGGEPLEYPLELLDILNNLRPGLNSILFSGYNLEEILAAPSKLAVIKKVDLSILGRYDDSLPHPYSGKKFVRTTDAVDMDYFRKLFNIEYHINGTQITKSGIFKL